MNLSELGPNVAILKSPSNWFLVFFSMALLGLIFHVIFTQKGLSTNG